MSVHQDTVRDAARHEHNSPAETPEITTGGETDDPCARLPYQECAACRGHSNLGRLISRVDKILAVLVAVVGLILFGMHCFSQILRFPDQTWAACLGSIARLCFLADTPLQASMCILASSTAVAPCTCEYQPTGWEMVAFCAKSKLANGQQGIVEVLPLFLQYWRWRLWWLRSRGSWVCCEYVPWLVRNRIYRWKLWWHRSWYVWVFCVYMPWLVRRVVTWLFIHYGPWLARWCIWWIQGRTWYWPLRFYMMYYLHSGELFALL